MLLLALVVSHWGAPVERSHCVWAVEPPAFSDDEVQYFEKRIRPILVHRCFECHSATTEKLKGGLRLDSRESLLRGGDSGPAAVPGNAAESLVVRAIRYDGDSQMPPAGKLPDSEIALLVDWIQRGAPFPKELPDKTTHAVDWESRRQHWSFQPLRAESAAPVGEPFREWVRNRLDGYVSREWTDRGLSSTGPADPRSLIRRVSSDLGGLPPTLSDQDEFVATEQLGNADAYDRLVDRQLASPRYGERWARHWLDLARYCDVPESWRESSAKAWLYRDWVIHALNADLPYDMFVRKQLAADLLPDAVPSENAALGFLGLSPSYWKELKLDQQVIKQVVAEEWEERVEAIGATFLGLTLACARCHDHKFDPISMHDYYALAGVLASIRLDDCPTIASADAGVARDAIERAKKLQVEIDKLAASKPVTDEIQCQIEEKRSELAQARQTPFFESPWVYGVSEASLHVLPDGPHRTKVEYHDNQPQDVAVQIRGNPANLGPVIPRRFLSMVPVAPALAGFEPPVAPDPLLFRTGSGRGELADALVTRAASLSTRVIVNRIWKHHFGRGLVTTPSNFGTQGEPPTHPELLDDLARQFVEHGWSLKRLHREIVLSSTYRQAAGVDESLERSPLMAHGRDHDPDNVWLWRSPVRRLDLEAWRDAMLLVTDQLDLQLGGAAVGLRDPANRRRTIYGQVKRRELVDIQRLHDFPDPVSHSATREPTTTPLQQLFTLNSPFFEQQSLALARRLVDIAPADVDRQVRQAYRAVLGRDPVEDERRIAIEYLEPGDLELLRQFAHALLASNEFVFID